MPAGQSDTDDADDTQESHTHYMFPDRETTSYMVRTPADDWTAWKAQLAPQTSVFERIHQLLLADIDGSVFPDGPLTAESALEHDIYDEWVRTVPRSTTLPAALNTLLEQDTRARSNGTDDDTKAYAFHVDAGLWSDWLDVVPESATTHDRLRTLLTEDLKAAYRDPRNETEQKQAQILINRIKHRSRTASQALDNDNEEKVVDQLEKIRDIADSLAE